MKENLEYQNILIDNSRNVIKVDGVNAGEFLQNLLTNDINQELAYSLLLTPQGKVLYDFFVYRVDNGFILDYDKNNQEVILDLFRKYKLRQKVNFTNLPNLQVVLSFIEYQNFTLDPRNNNLGYRAIIDRDQLDRESDIQRLFNDREIDYDYNHENSLVSEYIDRCYDLTLVRFMRDYYSAEYFPFELGLENFNAISYQKGCYIGQEVITRTKFLGVVRRRVYRLKLAEYVWPEQIYGIKHGDEILCNHKKVGVVLGCYRTGILGIMRDEAIDGCITIGEYNDVEISQ